MPCIDVAIIRSNSIYNDPRVTKLALSLSKKYNVVVLGWDREISNKESEAGNSRLQFKLLKLRAPYGRISIVGFYPIFWMWVLFNLIIFRPKVIHACDLDTLIPSYPYRVLFSRKLVFDSFDRFAMAYISQKNVFAYRAVDALENILAHKVDALVTVSEERLSIFGNYKPVYSEIILNCPHLDFNSVAPSAKNQYENKLTIVYAGSLASDRGVSILDEAVSGLDGVKLVLAGRMGEGSVRKVLQNPNICYVGLLTYNEALKLQSSADIIPLLYDPSVPINRVASPNKLFEAMMLGIPVLANVCPDIVETEGCGLLVQYDASAVREAILRLKNNPSLRQMMGAKGRVASQKIYNWSLMETKLLKLYSLLLKSVSCEGKQLIPFQTNKTTSEVPIKTNQ